MSSAPPPAPLPSAASRAGTSCRCRCSAGIRTWHPSPCARAAAASCRRRSPVPHAGTRTTTARCSPRSSRSAPSGPRCWDTHRTPRTSRPMRRRAPRRRWSGCCGSWPFRRLATRSARARRCSRSSTRTRPSRSPSRPTTGPSTPRRCVRPVSTSTRPSFEGTSRQSACFATESSSPRRSCTASPSPSARICRRTIRMRGSSRCTMKTVRRSGSTCSTCTLATPSAAVRG